MRAFLEWYLPIYLVLFFGFAFIWRTWRTWKKTGVNPYRLLASEGAEGVIARYFRVLPVVSLLVGLVYLLFPSFYAMLGRIVWLEQTWVAWTGVALSSVALLIIVLAQSQMGESWRIGVDYEHSTELVSEGLFRYSRNPIFLGIVMSAAGFFLILPNALTLLILVLDHVLVEMQVRFEEQRLETLHGERYRAFCAEVPRWL